MSMLERYPQLRYIFITSLACFVLILVSLAALGELTLQPLLAVIAGEIFTVMFVFIMGRWVLPSINRLVIRMNRESTSSPDEVARQLRTIAAWVRGAAAVTAIVGTVVFVLIGVPVMMYVALAIICLSMVLFGRDLTKGSS